MSCPIFHCSSATSTFQFDGFTQEMVRAQGIYMCFREYVDNCFIFLAAQHLGDSKIPATLLYSLVQNLRGKKLKDYDD